MRGKGRGEQVAPCRLVVQMFYNGAGIPDIYSIRFSVHAKGIFAIWVSLFIYSSASLFFCIFMHAMLKSVSNAAIVS